MAPRVWAGEGYRRLLLGIYFLSEVVESIVLGGERVDGVVDTVRSLTTPAPEGDWTSVAVCSDGSYGIDAGLIASMPIRDDADGRWDIVPGVDLDEFSCEKVDATVQELREERDAVGDLL